MWRTQLLSWIHIYVMFNIRTYVNFRISSYFKKFLMHTLGQKCLIWLCLLLVSFYLCMSLNYDSQKQVLFANNIFASFQKV